MFLILGVLSGVLATSGCGPNDPNGSGDTQMQGKTQYQDAQTDKQGQPQQPAKPSAQPMSIEITMSGTGTFPNLAPTCSADGKFSGSAANQTTIDSSGGYMDVLSMADGHFTTDLGCQIPDLKVAQVLSFKVVAKLENTQQNCQTYCDAQVRASCESQCNGEFSSTQGRATCRSSCEASGSGSCQTHCTGSTTRRIIAEAELSAAALAQLNASRAGLDGAGELNIDLTFSKVTE